MLKRKAIAEYKANKRREKKRWKSPPIRERCRIVKKEFDNGGSVLNCSFKLEDIQEMSENGWVNLTIAKRREPSDKGATHYAYKNEFKAKE